MRGFIFLKDYSESEISVQLNRTEILDSSK